MTATISTITRPRSLTASTSTSQHPHSPRYSNFRPIRYQTKEELDRFFGTTAHQKREQRLRVRESDGQVYFDPIEKDEWQHLLARGSPGAGSAADGEERRRSSVATFLTLNSPLSPGTPARQGSVGGAQSGEGMSPLVGSFGHVGLGEAEGEGERRGRKRSSSALAARHYGERVDDEAILGGVRPVFKRRQSDLFDPTSHDDEAQHAKDKIRLSRLPLARHRLNQETLDVAFAINPLLDLAPDAALIPRNPFAPHKPSALHIPAAVPPRATLIEHDTVDDSCYSSSPPRSPTTVDAPSARRSTFGSLFPQIAAQQPVRLRRASDVGTTPPSSSAMMEFLASPSPSTTSYDRNAGKALRHAASFDTPRRTAFPDAVSASISASAGKWAQRQRWHSEGKQVAEPKLRAVRSVASLRESASAGAGELPTTPAARLVELPRLRKLSNSSEGSSGSSCEPCFTPLAPRTGAKKFDRTREQHLNLTTAAASPPSTTTLLLQLPPMSDPIIPSPAPEKKEKPKMGSGLRTGPEVYQGVDIPCASIHLHSDPEDNVEPALALSMSASKLKKMKKNNARSSSSDASALARCPSTSGSSVGMHAKGSSRWWSNILHS